MYNLIEKEDLIKMFPILDAKETAILNMVSADGISISSPFQALKQLYPSMAEGIKKNSFNDSLDAGSLLLHTRENGLFILTMPIQYSWKTDYDIEYVHKGFLKISSVYKSRNLNSIAIQEGIIPKDVIDKFIETLDLPEIVYYKET